MPQTDSQDYHQMALPPGFQLEEYRLEDVLGKGGFGITYLASDSHLSHKVAIKELMPDGIATRVQTTTVVPQTRSQTENFEWAQQRFVDEARALARLNHPNIVRVLRLLRANGTAYMVMEYIQGRSLEDWMKHLPGPPPEEDLRRYITPILDGLEYIHKQGLFHRDIKPDNIFLRSDGQPVLIDFGSARADLGKTMMMTSVVTHGYSPFEQYQTQSRQGPYTDFYSLAAVMFRAVTGKKPPSAIDRISDDSQVGPALEAAKGQYSEKFLTAIEKGMALKIENRPQNADEFRQLLAHGAIKPAAVVAKSPEAAPPPPLPPKPAPQAEPTPAVTTSGASFNLLTIHGLLGFFLASLWIVSVFHDPYKTGAVTVPSLLASVAAFILPFCALWPLISSTGQKMGAANLYLFSLAGATVGTVLLASCAAVALFMSGSSFQVVGAKAFRVIFLVEWILLWTAWMARPGLEPEQTKSTPLSAWMKMSASVGGVIVACLLASLVQSMGVVHGRIFFPLGFSCIAGALATVMGLSMPRSAQPRQDFSLRSFERQAEFPIWMLVLMGTLMMLVGHQAGDFASIVAPAAKVIGPDFAWLVRVVCWIIGMGVIVVAMPRHAARIVLTVAASVSLLVSFLPSLVGYSGAGPPQGPAVDLITPLLEGLLQGAFLGGMALWAGSPAPQVRVASGMLTFITFIALGGVFSVVMAVFLDPRLARFDFPPRSPFGEHAELWHATTWTPMAITQAVLAALLVGVIQIGVRSSSRSQN